MEVGFFYSVFKEKKAVDYSVQQLRVHYPDSRVYLVSDGGLDYSYLEDDNLKTSLEEDTMGEIFGEDIVRNFKTDHYQDVIKTCAYTVLNRILMAIGYCRNPEWMVMCDPDCLVRGPLTFSNEGKILGTRLNTGVPEGYANVIRSIPGAVPITVWGASPCVFHTQTFLTALAKFRYLDKHENLLSRLTMEWFALCAHDVLFPTIFSLIGEEEVFNQDLVECTRNANWRNTEHPLVHQFREYY